MCHGGPLPTATASGTLCGIQGSAPRGQLVNERCGMMKRITPVAPRFAKRRETDLRQATTPTTDEKVAVMEGVIAVLP